MCLLGSGLLLFLCVKYADVYITYCMLYICPCCAELYVEGSTTRNNIISWLCQHKGYSDTVLRQKKGLIRKYAQQYIEDPEQAQRELAELRQATADLMTEEVGEQEQQEVEEQEQHEVQEQEQEQQEVEEQEQQEVQEEEQQEVEEQEQQEVQEEEQEQVEEQEQEQQQVEEQEPGDGGADEGGADGLTALAAAAAIAEYAEATAAAEAAAAAAAGRGRPQDAALRCRTNIGNKRSVLEGAVDGMELGKRQPKLNRRYL